MARTPKDRRGKGRRARGTGTIFPATRRGKPVWIGRKPVGRTAAGKTVYREVWGKTQAAVVKKLAAAGPPGEDTTVAELVARWLPTLTVRVSTKAGYVENLDQHILPALGHLKVSAVKPSHVEALAAALTETKDLHVNTARKILDTARLVFSAAVRDDLIPKNPVSVARRPKAERKSITPFTPAELRTIIDSCGDLSTGPTIALLAATGCRLGEAAALDVADWNPKAGTVSITKTYSKRFGVGPPKSKYSRRTITVPAAARPLVASAVGGRTDGPVFVTGAGNRVIKSLVQRAFARLLARLELEPRNVHQMRHSVATALISAGTPLGDVAKYLGDSVQTVVKTYLHPSGTDPGADLDKILGG